jgi:hypothetical protein
MRQRISRAAAAWLASTQLLSLGEVTMPIPRFDTEDLDDGPSPPVLKEAILDLMLSWPKLEHGLTYWIAFAQGVAVSDAAAALGTMSNRNKIKKLTGLYAHRDDQKAVELLANVAKEHETFARVRNTVAHAMLMGTSRSEPNTAYFLTTMAVPDEQGFMEVRRLAFSSFKEARDFAIERAMNIRHLLKSRGADVD